ncbi:MAG: hypothetical protein HQK81_00455 [Desulfovibrionaceae bacterium]|nr:hypothetical protein [Desulfovibrionaceae bacterium]MBF0512518.1 hypothetical protein [Desulfovibrionaceae bacterium]
MEEKCCNCFGEWLAHAQERSQGYAWAMFAFLAFLVALNFLIYPEEGHFVLDVLPGFWAVFGLGVAVGMTLVLKKIIFPLISRSEDFYDRGN